MLSREEFRIIKIIIAWAAGLLIATLFGSGIIEHVPNGGIGAPSPDQLFNYLQSLAQWDGGHYLSIAQNGYTYPAQHAYFPLYPTVLRIFGNALGNFLVPGLIFNFTAFAVSAIILYRIIKTQWDKHIGSSAVYVLIAFPASFFFLVLYTESLFILLVLLTVYFCQKKQFLIASVFAALAGLTRSVGVILTLVIAIEYLKTVKFSPKKLGVNILSVAIAPLGFAAYTYYLYKTYGSFTYYLTAQQSWQRHLTNPLSTIYAYLQDLPLSVRPANDYLDLAISLIILATLLLSFKKIPFSWWLFSILVFVPALSSGTLSGVPRYVLPSFGFFIIWANLLLKYQFLKFLYFSIGFTLQVVLALIFINGHWVS